jgi:hypothetical protein
MHVRALTRVVTGRYRNRLIAGVLLVSIPVTALMVLVMASRASAHLDLATRLELQRRADVAAVAVDGWVAERKADAAGVAREVSLGLARERVSPLLVAQTRDSNDLAGIEVVTAAGAVVSSSGRAQEFSVQGQDWFRDAASGRVVISPVFRTNGPVLWVFAAPVVESGGRVSAVVLVHVKVSALLKVLGPLALGRTGVLEVADPDSRILVSTDPRTATVGSVEAGASPLPDPQPEASRTLALQGKSGFGAFTDETHTRVYVGYGAVTSLGWAVTGEETRSVALASISSLRRTGLMLTLIGLAVLALAAWVLSILESRHIRGIIDVSRHAGMEMTGSASDLSAAAAQLASSAAEQTAAVTETSATMEELSRTSVAIADTVDVVTSKAEDARVRLGQAERDIEVSSERTLELANRVKDISGILALINEIADQTNLLALNAAIEAARAGEAGRGFAVVADEVRGLAERSKVSAAEIALIVNGAQTETNATVMAMDQGAKSMQHSLVLLEEMMLGAEQVRLTTQQQRMATEQVVQAMSQATESSREICATTVQVSTAADELLASARQLDTAAVAAAARI